MRPDKGGGRHGTTGALAVGDMGAEGAAATLTLGHQSLPHPSRWGAHYLPGQPTCL